MSVKHSMDRFGQGEQRRRNAAAQPAGSGNKNLSCNPCDGRTKLATPSTQRGTHDFPSWVDPSLHHYPPTPLDHFYIWGPPLRLGPNLLQ